MFELIYNYLEDKIRYHPDYMANRIVYEWKGFKDTLSKNTTPREDKYIYDRRTYIRANNIEAVMFIRVEPHGIYKTKMAYQGAKIMNIINNQKEWLYD
jgi:hypothetical protein